MMTRNRILCAALLASASPLLGAVPAMGQGTPPQNTMPDQAPAVAQSSADIVVTATREKTLLSKTPIAMSAIAGDALRAQGVTNPTTISELVPNLSIDRVNNGVQITIRGVTSTDTTEKGDPSAAFMLNGIYIARPQAQEVSLFDIERVEVLRGPQGTLYGRNTTAGVVNVISAAPVLGKLSGSLDASYGNYNTTNETGVLNIPMGESMALRAAVNYDHRDSYLYAGANFRSNMNAFKDNLSGRLSWLYKADRLSLLLVGDYSRIEGTTNNSLPVTNFFSGNAPTVPGTTPLYTAANAGKRALLTNNTTFATDLDQHNYTWGISGDLKYDFGLVSLNYLGSYRAFHRNEDNLAQQTQTTALPTTYKADYWQNSQELRLATNGTGPFKMQTGLYYFRENGVLNYTQLNSPVGTTNTFQFQQNPVKAESYAAFGQASYAVLAGLRLTAGVRYSHDDKSRIGQNVACAGVVCTPAELNPAITPGVTVNNAQIKSGKVTWRAGVEYDLNNRTLLYGTVSSGYKAGGFNGGCQSGTPGCTGGTQRIANALYYQPETLTAYEVGLKTRFADNKVRLNLSAFHYDYSNLQLTGLVVCTVNGVLCSNTINAAAAKVSGVEAEATLQPARTDRISFNVNYLDAHYSSYSPTFSATGTTVNWTGFKMDRAPTWTASVDYAHSFFLSNGGNVEAGIHSRMSDAYYLQSLAQVIQFRQPGFTKTDATLTYNAPGKSWYMQGYVKNLENALVVTTASGGAAGVLAVADPRTYGVRAGFKF